MLVAAALLESRSEGQKRMEDEGDNVKENTDAPQTKPDSVVSLKLDDLQRLIETSVQRAVEKANPDARPPATGSGLGEWGSG